MKRVLPSSSVGLITRLREIFQDSEQYRKLLRCQGPVAQKVLDCFQQILDTSELDTNFRRQLIVATQRISEHSGLYPTSYELKNIIKDRYPVTSGAFADIFMGDFEGQTVCLKAVRIHRDKDTNHFLKQFSKEAVLWYQLSHPNLLPLYGVFRFQNRPCFVSPWMSAGDLTQYLKDKPQAARLPLAVDVAKGLSYLHEHGIIHGDLKGPNVLVNDAGVACVADFGLSLVSDSEILAWKTFDSNTTVIGGSTRWQAPELFDVEGDTSVKSSLASDVYAWSFVCYEAFTGEIPLSNLKHPGQFILHVVRGARPTRPADSSPAWRDWGLNESIWSIMEKCWSADPLERPTIKHVMSVLIPQLSRDDRPQLARDDRLSHWKGIPSPMRFRESMGRKIDMITVPELDELLDNSGSPSPNDPMSTADLGKGLSMGSGMGRSSFAKSKDASTFTFRTMERTELVSSDVIISRLEKVLQDTQLYQKLVARCKGPVAQNVLDFFQQLLDIPLLDSGLRRRLIVATQKITKRSGLYPTCYELRDIKIQSQHPISGGSFADIYQGDFEGQPVCLKVIRLYQHTEVEHFSKQVSKEAVLWCQLSHPNIIPIYGLFRFQNRPCLVSPWMSGGNMTEYLEHNPQVARLPLAMDVAEGLSYLHKHWIIHGDLNGSNILVDDAGVAYVAGFGLSSVSDPEIPTWASHSAAASTGGTTRWQAPELFAIENDTSVKNTTASDVYAWSLVCYEAFTGNIPYSQKERDFAVMLYVMHGGRPIRPPDSSPPWRNWGLNEIIWSIMEKCWSADPMQRPAIEEVISSLMPQLPVDERLNKQNSIMSSVHFRKKMSGDFNMITLSVLSELLDDDFVPTPPKGHVSQTSGPLGNSTLGFKAVGLLDKSAPLSAPTSTKPSSSQTILNEIIHTSSQTADLAFHHAQNKESDLLSVLQRLQWEGVYLIQAGYNEEMLYEGYFVEEIHVSLDSELPIPEAQIESEFLPILSPFLSYIHTPNVSVILGDSPQIRAWSISESGGTDRSALAYTVSDQTSNYIKSVSAGAEGSDDGPGDSGGDEPDQTHGDTPEDGGESGGKGNKGGDENVDRKDTGGGGSGGEGSSGGSGGGDQGPGGTGKDRDKGGCSITVPFRSILFDQDQTGNQRDVSTISSNVKITVEENLEQDKPAPNSDWLGPWVSVHIDRLEGNASGAYLPHQYLLSQSHAQIIGISERDISVPYHSPQSTPDTEDTVKRREDKTTTRGLQVTTTPGVNATLIAAHLSSAESIHKRWGIRTHPVDNENGIGQKMVGTVWKYVHNHLSQRVPVYTFSDSTTRSPFIELGVGNAADAYTRLNLDVTMHWSLSSMRKTFFESIASFFKTTEDRQPILIPAFVNFFHKASISIDLRQFDKEKGWVTGAKTKDPMPTGKSSADVTQRIVRVLTKDGESRCEVILGTAIYGKLLATSKKEKSST